MTLDVPLSGWSAAVNTRNMAVLNTPEAHTSTANITCACPAPTIDERLSAHRRALRGQDNKKVEDVVVDVDEGNVYVHASFGEPELHGNHDCHSTIHSGE